MRALGHQRREHLPRFARAARAVTSLSPLSEHARSTVEGKGGSETVAVGTGARDIGLVPPVRTWKRNIGVKRASLPALTHDLS